MRFAASSFLLCALLSQALAQELPKRDPNRPLDFEPELQLYDIKPDPNVSRAESWAVPDSPVALEKAKTSAERAQRKADRWQKLQKAGIISKVEMEQAVGAANRATVRFQQARVAQITSEL